jgi:hypothetical protein
VNEKQPIPKNPSLYRRKSRWSGFAFEVNPLISQIALCNEADILDRWPEVASLDHANRVAEIFKERFFHDVTEVDSKTLVWVPTNRIERDCGGSSILAPSRYQL